jgi:hypothetical protein
MRDRTKGLILAVIILSFCGALLGTGCTFFDALLGVPEHDAPVYQVVPAGTPNSGTRIFDGKEYLVIQSGTATVPAKEGLLTVVGEGAKGTGIPWVTTAGSILLGLLGLYGAYAKKKLANSVPADAIVRIGDEVRAVPAISPSSDKKDLGDLIGEYLKDNEPAIASKVQAAFKKIRAAEKK